MNVKRITTNFRLFRRWCVAVPVPNSRKNSNGPSRKRPDNAASKRLNDVINNYFGSRWISSTGRQEPLAAIKPGGKTRIRLPSPVPQKKNPHNYTSWVVFLTKTRACGNLPNIKGWMWKRHWKIYRNNHRPKTNKPNYRHEKYGNSSAKPRPPVVPMAPPSSVILARRVRRNCKRLKHKCRH